MSLLVWIFFKMLFKSIESRYKEGQKNLEWTKLGALKEHDEGIKEYQRSDGGDLARDAGKVLHSLDDTT